MRLESAEGELHVGFAAHAPAICPPPTIHSPAANVELTSGEKTTHYELTQDQRSPHLSPTYGSPNSPQSRATLEFQPALSGIYVFKVFFYSLHRRCCVNRKTGER